MEKLSLYASRQMSGESNSDDDTTSLNNDKRRFSAGTTYARI